MLLQRPRRTPLKKAGAITLIHPQNGGSLSEEIVVTTAYKPVLADAVKIRRNPDLEDKVPFKAPLIYAPLDKRQEQNSEIRQLEANEKACLNRILYCLTNYVAKVGFGKLKTIIWRRLLCQRSRPGFTIWWFY
jgi:hypothetical protein